MIQEETEDARRQEVRASLASIGRSARRLGEAMQAATEATEAFKAAEESYKERCRGGGPGRETTSS